MAIYFLSIRSEYVEMILFGSKRWEFRKNLRFGNSLSVGDQVFIVSTSAEGGAVNGLCRIEKILRGQEVEIWFGDRATGHWREAGCADGTERDWGFFAENILRRFPVAIRFAPTQLPPVSLFDITHRTSGKPWRGIGLTPWEAVGNYLVGSFPADRFFAEMADSLG